MSLSDSKKLIFGVYFYLELEAGFDTEALEFPQYSRVKETGFSCWTHFFVSSISERLIWV